MSEIPKKGCTDWMAVRCQSEEMIKKAADVDPDARLLTATELKQFKCIRPILKLNRGGDTPYFKR